MTPRQCKAARALLGWSQTVLAENARASLVTVARFEAGAEVRERTRYDLQRALEDVGIEFLDDGVRLVARA
ncbi:MAG: XRE family transcriptional regulator [Myxococcales bacterium]|nr:XRE family transcriptional regulator [Myxococcales bacterium]